MTEEGKKLSEAFIKLIDHLGHEQVATYFMDVIQFVEDENMLAEGIENFIKETFKITAFPTVRFIDVDGNKLPIRSINLIKQEKGFNSFDDREYRLIFFARSATGSFDEILRIKRTTERQVEVFMKDLRKILLPYNVTFE